MALFDSLVLPILTYSCEIWGVEIATPSFDKCLDHPIEKFHTSFIRHACGLSQGTSKWIMLYEFARLPILYSIWRRVINFLHRIIKLPDGDIMKQVFLADQELYLQNKPCWCKSIIAFLQKIGVPHYMGEVTTRPSDSYLVSLSTVTKSVIKQRLLTLWNTELLAILNSGSNSSKTKYYFQHIAEPVLCPSRMLKWSAPASHLSCAIPTALHSSLIRFRLGNYSLQCEVARWAESRGSVVSRVCPCCRQEQLENGFEVDEDELHYIFDCPKYSDIRADPQFSAMLLGAQRDLRALFLVSDQFVLAAYLKKLGDCRRLRE